MTGRTRVLLALLVAALAMVVVGIALVSVPAAWIAAGVGTAALAIASLLDIGD